jgi:hypothetical protein
MNFCQAFSSKVLIVPITALPGLLWYLANPGISTNALLRGILLVVGQL